MMTLAFPSNPSVGQVYQLWTWDGQKWVCNCVGGIGPTPPVTGNGVIGMPNKTLVFTNSGVYTPSPGITSIVVECIGGGGGGGNAAADLFVQAAGGGGSGGYSRSVLLPAQIGSSQLVTIGAGGAATLPGGPTSFGTLVIANGGGGGESMDNITHWGRGGNEAIAGTGNVAIPGNPGLAGIATPTPTLVAYGGRGAFIFGGGAGQPFVAAVSGAVGLANGLPGTPGTGAGGSGGCTTAQQVMTAIGGIGGSGLCIVTEYMPATA